MYNNKILCLLGSVLLLGLSACSEELQPRDNASDPQGTQYSSASSSSALVAATGLQLLDENGNNLLAAAAQQMEEPLIIYMGQTYTLQAQVLPIGADQEVVGTSSNLLVFKTEQVADVPGLLTLVPQSEGFALVRVSSADGEVHDSLHVQVIAPSTTVAAKSLTLGRSGTGLLGDTLYVNKGQSVQLVAAVEPANAAISLAWTSSAPSLVPVSSEGLITARQAGASRIGVVDGKGLGDYVLVVVQEEVYGSIWDVRKNKVPTVATGGNWGIQLSNAALVPTSVNIWAEWQDQLAAGQPYMGINFVYTGTDVMSGGGSMRFNLKADSSQGAYEGRGLCLSYRSSSTVHVQLLQPEVKDFDYHKKQVPASSNWTTVDILQANFKQQGWDIAVPYESSKITGVSILLPQELATPGTTQELQIRAVGVAGECRFLK